MLLVVEPHFRASWTHKGHDKYRRHLLRTVYKSRKTRDDISTAVYYAEYIFCGLLDILDIVEAPAEHDVVFGELVAL